MIGRSCNGLDACFRFPRHGAATFDVITVAVVAVVVADVVDL